MIRAGTLMLASVLMLSACTWYHPAPLAAGDTQTSPSQLQRIRIDASSMPLPALARHRFDPSDGFDIDEIAMLAVVNNPGLRLARDNLGIARAQAFAAGLLPDPQLNVSSDYTGAPSATRAFLYGMTFDVTAMLMRSSRKHIADAGVTQTDLGLLWQEWQVVAQAKQLFVRSRFQMTSLPLLQQQYRLNETRYERMLKAREAGNLTGDILLPAFTAYSDSRKAYYDAQRAAEQTHHDLNALLGISPSVTLTLTGNATDETNDTDDPALSDTAAALHDACATLPQRRPDLIALRAGYTAQDEKYRAAILAQFPALTVGFNRQRDTSNVYTTGFAINLTLPIFNRNRGNIAIEDSTRKQLQDDYQSRLNTAYADIAHLSADAAILHRQLAASQAGLPSVERNADNALDAYRHRTITLAAYTDMAFAATAKQLEIATLREAYDEQRIALEALLGNVLPDTPSSPSTF